MRQAPPLRSDAAGSQGRLFGVWSPWLLLLTTMTALAVRVFDLDRLPGEIYGDIAIVYEYVADILGQNWPIGFVLSAGPLYHYVIMPIVLLGGLDYLTLKIASVAVSLVGLAATYAVGRELIDDDLGLLATWVAGISSWWLIFSRLGNSQVLVPLLTLGVLWFAARVARLGRRRDAVGCALVAALGLYTYPQTFVLPPVMFLTLFCLRWARSEVRWSHLLIFAATTLLGGVPFIFIVAADPANFFTGYIGGKLASTGNSPMVLGGNIVRGLLALHVRGDVVFRSNPTLRPHLDPISGVLFLIGTIFWLRPERRRMSLVLLLPLVLLQLPSMLVLSKPIEIPSASRTLGIAPIAYLLVASGLWWLAQRWRSTAGRGLIFLLCAVLLLLNGNRYFRLYADGLPNHNAPFGRIIAAYADSLPTGTDVVVLGCCWGEWGQPEPKGVLYALKQPRTLRVLDPARVSCEYLSRVPRPTVLIWQPYRARPSLRLAPCADWLRPELHRVAPGGPVFYSSPVRPTLTPKPSPKRGSGG